MKALVVSLICVFASLAAHAEAFVGSGSGYDKGSACSDAKRNAEINAKPSYLNGEITNISPCECGEKDNINRYTCTATAYTSKKN